MTTTMTTTRKGRPELAELGLLILDYSIYPRKDISSQNISALVRAIEAGHTLPPIIADRATKRVVDGFHRCIAYTRAGRAPADKVLVEWRDYQSDAELFLDAVRSNAQHGQRLSPLDISIVAVRAEKLGLTQELVAGALNVTAAALSQLTVDRYSSSRTVDGPVVLKRSIRHMAGQKLTKDQVEANEHLAGMSQRFYINQVTLLLESGLLDLSRASVRNDLRRLGELIKATLEKQSP